MFNEPLAGGVRQQHVNREPNQIGLKKSPCYLMDATPTVTSLRWCVTISTPTPKGAFFEVCPPQQARAYVRRINFCYTPKYGSWLNLSPTIKSKHSVAQFHLQQWAQRIQVSLERLGVGPVQGTCPGFPDRRNCTFYLVSYRIDLGYTAFSPSFLLV